MNIFIKLLFSLLIGAIGLGVAKLVHPDWNINHLLWFGLLVFVVTFLLTLIIKKG
jgi:uncharacterized membrane protein